MKKHYLPSKQFILNLTVLQFLILIIILYKFISALPVARNLSLLRAGPKPWGRNSAESQTETRSPIMMIRSGAMKLSRRMISNAKSFHGIVYGGMVSHSEVVVRSNVQRGYVFSGALSGILFAGAGAAFSSSACSPSDEMVEEAATSVPFNTKIVDGSTVQVLILMR